MSYPAKKWKKGVHKAIKTSYNLPELITGDVEVSIKWYLKYNRDIDGGLKLLLDSFEKSFIANDKQVKALHIFKEKDNKNPRVEVFIKLL
jgi:Holliday junction resolvase RusA-like endonuclease